MAGRNTSWTDGDAVARFTPLRHCSNQPSTSPWPRAERFTIAFTLRGCSLGCKLVTADQKLYNALRAGPFADDVLWVADPI